MALGLRPSVCIMGPGTRHIRWIPETEQEMGRRHNPRQLPHVDGLGAKALLDRAIHIHTVGNCNWIHSFHMNIRFCGLAVAHHVRRQTYPD